MSVSNTTKRVKAIALGDVPVLVCIAAIEFDEIQRRKTVTIWIYTN